MNTHSWLVLSCLVLAVASLIHSWRIHRLSRRVLALELERFKLLWQLRNVLERDELEHIDVPGGSYTLVPRSPKCRVCGMPKTAHATGCRAEYEP